MSDPWEQPEKEEPKLIQEPIQPSAILVAFGVSCGDRTETRRVAIEVARDTTLGALIDEHLSSTFLMPKDIAGARPLHDCVIEIRPIIRADHETILHF